MKSLVTGVLWLQLSLTLNAMADTLHEFDAIIDGAHVVSIRGSGVGRELSSGKVIPSVTSVETQFDTGVAKKNVPPRGFKEVSGEG